MSSQPSYAHAFAGPTGALRASREDELLADNDALVLAVSAAESAQRVAEEALRRQTQALALAAHELRNPLMPIRTVAALLGTATSLDQSPRLGAIIERQVMYMTRMIDDLLDAARAATGKLHLDRTRLDLREVFDNVLDVCKPAMDLRRQTFELRVPDRPLVLEGDLVRLTQVFTNIVNNASKYTPVHGAIALDCRVAARGARAGEVVVAVSDNGIGISPEALPMIWEPFVQDALAIGYSKEGLGIGLTLVRDLVRAHAGSVAAASAGEGQGSVFTVTLPLA
ncbi:MAG: HAMP domain-containing histidine kinase [Pseudomonadota bacterium]|nr:HAMP domain-containing histidine kinase [Pseudomonadota bacterium]